MCQKNLFDKKIGLYHSHCIEWGETCLKYNFLSEVCFGMIFQYFAIDLMDIYGPNGICLKYKFLSEVCFGMIF